MKGGRSSISGYGPGNQGVERAALSSVVVGKLALALAGGTGKEVSFSLSGAL